MRKNKKKFLKSSTYSLLGIFTLATLLITINIIFSNLNLQIDITEDKLYTLSDETKKLIKNIDAPITIKFYFSRNIPSLPVELKSYVRRLEGRLQEYQRLSKNTITLQKINPKPSSTAETSALEEGIIAKTLPTGERLYLGIVVACLDKKIVIPRLSIAREHFLEYDISRAILNVLRPKKQTIAIISSLPVQGPPPQQLMRGIAGATNTPPWQIIQELATDYQLQYLDYQTTTIPPNINLLLIIHPSKISIYTQFAIDQYILAGGKAIIFLDAMNMISTSDPTMDRTTHRLASTSSLIRLLNTWGVKFQTNQIIADLKYKTSTTTNGPAFPQVLSLDSQAVNNQDPTMAGIQSICYVYGGSFQITPQKNLTYTTLLHSSPQSQPIESYQARMTADELTSAIKFNQGNQPLAIRIQGNFQTAFPQGKPKPKHKIHPFQIPPKKTKKPKPTIAALKKSQKPSQIILIGDADMLNDRFCVKSGTSYGYTMNFHLNDNIKFTQNLVSQMCGDQTIIKIRAKSVRERPFTTLQEIYTKAELKYRQKLKELTKQLATTHRKIDKIHLQKSEDQVSIWSKEQSKQLLELNQKETILTKQIITTKKALHKEVIGLQTKIKFYNILLMPIIVACLGLIIAAIQKWRNS